MRHSGLAPSSLGPTICVGEILVEIVATSIGDGFMEPIELVGPFPSGAPAIFIDQCAKMACPTAMIGAVGDDDFGLLNRERLRQDGVDVSGISIDADLPTGSAFVRYRDDGLRDFVYNIVFSAAARFGWTPNVKAIVEKAGHLHVMGSALSMPGSWAVIEKAVGIVKSRGGSISLDPNLRKELQYDDETERRFAWLVEMTDLLLPSGEELEKASGVNGLDASLASLFKTGIQEIVLKKGSEGASCFTPDGSQTHSTAFVVVEVDPTGAGDCFGGAYVACRRLGMNVQESLDYANAAGARNVSVRGPMEGAGSRKELDLFMSKTKRTS